VRPLISAVRLLRGGWGPLAIASLILAARYAPWGTTTTVEIVVVFAIAAVVVSLLVGGRMTTATAGITGSISAALVTMAVVTPASSPALANALWLSIPIMWLALQVWLFIQWHDLHTHIPRAFPSAKYLPTLIGMSLGSLVLFDLAARQMAGSTLTKMVSAGLAVGHSGVAAKFDAFLASYPSLKFDAYGLLLLVGSIVATGAGETRLAHLRDTWSDRRAEELTRFQREALRPSSLDSEDAKVEARIHQEFIRTIHGIATVLFSFWLVIKEIPNLLIAAFHDLVITIRTNVMATVLVLCEAVTSAPAAFLAGAAAMLGTGSLFGHMFGLSVFNLLGPDVTLVVVAGSLLYLAVIAEFGHIRDSMRSVQVEKEYGQVFGSVAAPVAVQAESQQSPGLVATIAHSTASADAAMAAIPESPIVPDVILVRAPRDGAQSSPVFALRFFVVLFAVLPAAVAVVYAGCHVLGTLGVPVTGGSNALITPALQHGLAVVVVSGLGAFVVGVVALLRDSRNRAMSSRRAERVESARLVEIKRWARQLPTAISVRVEKLREFAGSAPRDEI
jgi:hypothetical protein